MKKFLLVFLILLLPTTLHALPNFPGAEGFGSETVGGRGGYVYKVTNLNDSGTGSLRACLEDDLSQGARICVFTTGGIIETSSALRIEVPYVTCAGQTAQGGGITIDATGAGNGIEVVTHDVVLRYLTVRGASSDGISTGTQSSLTNVYNIIIDHCSISWCVDENTSSWYSGHDITWSYNLNSEALDYSAHSKGYMLGGHFGGSPASPNYNYYGHNFSFHHNVGAHNSDRNGPYLRGAGITDIVNNIFYNPGGNIFAYAADENPVALLKVNLISNYFKMGPDTVAGWGWRALDFVQTGGAGVETYVSGNYHSTMRTSGSQDEDTLVYTNDRTIEGSDTTGSPLAHLVVSKWPAPAVTEYSAFNTLLPTILPTVGNSQRVDCAGSWINKRDAIDEVIINDIQNGTGAIIDNIVDSYYGGFVTISSGSACTDTDGDGMPDTFELTFGFDPETPDDSDDEDENGYTNIEEYINGTAVPPVLNNKMRISSGACNG